MKNKLTLLLLIISLVSVHGQVLNYPLYSIDINGLLLTQRSHKTVASSIQLPLPDGEYDTFDVIPNNLLAPELQAQYPGIHTFDIIARNDVKVTGKLTFGGQKVYAMIETEDGLVTITPSIKNTELYKSYFGQHDPEVHSHDLHFECGVKETQRQEKPQINRRPLNTALFSRGTNTKTYRLVVVTTDEFYALNGSNSTQAMAIITNTVQGWNIIYQKDLGIQFNLVGTKIYTNDASNPDPFTPNSGSRTNQAAEVVHSNFGFSTYDIGHVFHRMSSGGSGVAGLNSLCSSRILDNDRDGLVEARKAAAWSGNSDNTTNGWIRLSAHEVGHQVGASHTFNGIGGPGGNCTNNIGRDNGYEIGSGTTIMSYNGLCQADNNIPSGRVQDNYFHTESIREMHTHINKVSSCGASSGSNSIPVINADPCGAGTVTIPKSTPFELTGNATDADGDALTYCWEQYDEDDEVYGANSITTQGKVGVTAAADRGAPLFRSYPPSSSPSRSFSRDGTSSSFEALPTVARNMTFAMTVRDGKGGVASNTREVTVSNSGPLAVTAPASGASWNAGSPSTVSWSTGGFTGCSNVNVKLSTDGGNTYPTVLASNVSFSALSTSLNLPSTISNTSNARIRIECADNSCATFYNVSPTFSISSSCLAAENHVLPTSSQTFGSGQPVNVGWNSSNIYYGSKVTSINADMSSAPTGRTPASTTEGGSTCTAPNFRGYKVRTYKFKVTQTGSYSFSHSGGLNALGIFSGVGSYDYSNPCSSGIFLKSNIYNSSSGYYSGWRALTVSLTANVEYTLVVTTGSSSLTVNMSGAGDILVQNTSPSTDYTYVYVLVSDADNKIKGVSSTADFGTSTSYVDGTYKVYGISYKSAGSNTSGWIGKSIPEVSTTTCVKQSTNSKPITLASSTNPVELLSFVGKYLNSAVQLTWQTAQEVDNSHFEVFRSPDSKDYTSIGTVKGNGTTELAQSYIFVDKAPLSGSNYYKLVQVDYDGKRNNHDQIVHVEVKRDNALVQVYPNPTDQQINIAFHAQYDRLMNISIYNTTGQKMYDKRVNLDRGYQVTTVDMSQYPEGVYVIKGYDGNDTFVKRIVKVK